MSSRVLVSGRSRAAITVAGWVGLAASVAALILGWMIVESIVVRLQGPVQLSVATIDAIEETLDLVDSVTGELETGLGTAGDSLAAASAAAADSSGNLEDLADFLDGDLVANIEAIQGSMPAAIQAAGAIDDTLRALSLLGVDYDPEQPFDESLRAIDAALQDLPTQLTVQAGAVRALVPTTERFAGDAAALASSISALVDDMERSGEILNGYRETVEEARSLVDETGATFTTSVWLFRAFILAAAIAGAALSIGLIAVGRREPGEVVAVDEVEVLGPGTDRAGLGR
jgi:hypothetical protein